MNYLQTFHRNFSTLTSPSMIAIALPSALVGGFLILSSEVRESIAGEKELIGAVDNATLNYLYGLRTPFLNVQALDITALGSGVVLTFVVLSLVLLFILMRRPALSLQLVSVALLSRATTYLLKNHFERVRPALANRLAEVDSFSYPSGHSLSSAAIYLTIAFTISALTPNAALKRIGFICAVLLIALVGMSRIYLGVHYFSDVVGGMMLGTSLALFGELIVQKWEVRRNVRSKPI